VSKSAEILLKSLVSLIALLSVGCQTSEKVPFSLHCLVDSQNDKLHCYSLDRGNFDLKIDEQEADKMVCVPGDEFVYSR